MAYAEKFGFSADTLDSLFANVKDTQALNIGTVDLMKALASANYSLFALSDNVHEIVAYLKETYDFWPLFEGAIISAEVGVLKPSMEIYQRLLGDFNLQPQETVFLDDMQHNVDGAKAAGLHAFQFVDVDGARDDLRGLGVNV